MRARLAPRQVNLRSQDFFRRHCIVEVDDSWRVLDDDNKLEPLDLDAVARLAAIDPPTGLDELRRATLYAAFVDDVTAPRRFTIDNFDQILWKKELTADECAQIEDLRTASRVEPRVSEQLGDRVVMRSWLVEGRKLICRVLTVFPTGAMQREDAVIGEGSTRYG